MTQLSTPNPDGAAVARPAPRDTAGAGPILSRLFEMLDRTGIHYCLTHGYEGYPHQIPSDVDLVVPAEVSPRRLVELLHQERDALGAQVVQRLDGETCYMVLAGQGDDGSPCFVPLDVGTDCDVRKRFFYSGREILGHRRRQGGFWVPPPDLEFGSYLIRKVAKGRLEDDHGRRLSELFSRDPEGCRRQVGRFWDFDEAGPLLAAAEAGDWRGVRKDLQRLRGRLLRRATLRHPVRVLLNWAVATSRRVGRWCGPSHGLSVVFLGPDGAGKSSVVRSVASRWAPAFSRTACLSFPPGLRRRGPEVTCKTPHDVPPRSSAMSVLRALLYWFAYCGPGYYATVRPALARLTLVLHDRHLVDTLVDPRRYRYTGPPWVLRLIWRLIPKPDLVILLDAPAEVIRSRKEEVSLEETERQCAAYRSLVGAMPNGHVVDASRPMNRVAADVDDLILRFLVARNVRGRSSPGPGE
jgi:thymidylate kinase